MIVISEHSLRLWNSINIWNMFDSSIIAQFSYYFDCIISILYYKYHLDLCNVIPKANLL